MKPIFFLITLFIFKITVFCQNPDFNVRLESFHTPAYNYLRSQKSLGESNVGNTRGSNNDADSYQHKVFERRGYNIQSNYHKSDDYAFTKPSKSISTVRYNESDPQARMLWKEITHSETYFKRETLMPLHVEPARCERYVRTEVALHIIDKEVKPFSTASFQKITSTPIYNFESKPSTVENETGGELPVSSGGFQPNKFEPVTSSANNEVIFQKDLSFIYNMFFIMHADAFCLNARERILSKKNPTLEEIESFFVTNAHCFNRQRIIRNILNYSGLFR
ncbi:MAG: hypothetical protein MH137_11995 [Flavobacteriales bacterium]|nr:hypothetical protein [Flavobacteriales bacterium]